MAKAYAERIDRVVNDFMRQTGGRFQWSTAKEAKAVLASLTQVQKELRLIKKELGMEKQEIRAEYAEARTEVAKSGRLLGAIFGSKTRAAVARGRANKRVDLRESQENALAPYDRLITYIDGKLVEFDRLKLQVQQKTAELGK